MVGKWNWEFCFKDAIYTARVGGDEKIVGMEMSHPSPKATPPWLSAALSFLSLLSLDNFQHVVYGPVAHHSSSARYFSLLPMTKTSTAFLLWLLQENVCTGRFLIETKVS